MIYIGDNDSDYQATKQIGVNFIEAKQTALLIECDTLIKQKDPHKLPLGEFTTYEGDELINLIHKIKKSINIEKTISIAVIFVFIGFLVAGMFEYNLGDTEIKFILFYFLSIPFLRFQTDILQKKPSPKRLKND